MGLMPHEIILDPKNKTDIERIKASFDVKANIKLSTREKDKLEKLKFLALFLIESAYSTPDIIAQYVERYGECHPNTVRYYISETRKLFPQLRTVDREIQRDYELQINEELYDNFLEDYKNKPSAKMATVLVKIRENIARLKGVHEDNGFDAEAAYEKLQLPSLHFSFNPAALKKNKTVDVEHEEL